MAERVGHKLAELHESRSSEIRSRLVWGLTGSSATGGHLRRSRGGCCSRVPTFRGLSDRDRGSDRLRTLGAATFRPDGGRELRSRLRRSGSRCTVGRVSVADALSQRPAFVRCFCRWPASSATPTRGCWPRVPAVSVMPSRCFTGVIWRRLWRFCSARLGIESWPVIWPRRCSPPRYWGLVGIVRIGLRHFRGCLGSRAIRRATVCAGAVLKIERVGVWAFRASSLMTKILSV